jgi:hypothetical protein
MVITILCSIHLDAINCRNKYKYLLQANYTINNTLHEPYNKFLCTSSNIYYIKNISNRIYRSLAICGVMPLWHNEGRFETPGLKSAP